MGIRMIGLGTYLLNTSATPSVGATGWPRLVGPPGQRLGRSASRHTAVRDAGWPYGPSRTAAAVAPVHGRAQDRGRGCNAIQTPVGTCAGIRRGGVMRRWPAGEPRSRNPGASYAGSIRKTDAQFANGVASSSSCGKHTNIDPAYTIVHRRKSPTP
jgi:hypothetical protein